MKSASAEEAGDRWFDDEKLAPRDPGPEDLSRLIRRAFGMRRYRPEPLPAVVHQLLSMTSSDDADFGAVAKVVAQDASLVAEILRIVNTAGYARGAPVESIEQAVNRLGFVALREVVAQAALVVALPRNPEYAAAIRTLNAHNVAVARLTRLVQVSSGVHQEHAFLAGFFHDLGFLASLMLIADVYGDEPPAIEAVWPELDRIHGQVGWIMAQLWRLPAPIPAIARTHHWGQMTQLMAVVHVADVLATESGVPAILNADRVAVDVFDAPRLQAAANELELTDEDLDELFATAPDVIRDG